MKPFRKLINKLNSENVNAILAKGSIAALSTKLISLPINFFSQIILTRLMEVEQYGIYIYVLSWLNILAILAKLGFDNASVKLISQLYTQKKWSSLKGFLISSFSITAISSLIVSLILIITIISLRNSLSLDLFWAFITSAFLLPFQVFSLIQQSILRGLKKIILSQSINLIQSFILILAVVIYCYIVKQNQIQAQEIIGINISIFFLTFGIFFFVLNKVLGNQLFQVSPNYEIKEWLKISIPMMFMSATFIILSRIDIIMIGWLLDSSKAGVYAIASRIADLMVFVLGAVSMILAPMISEIYSKGEKSQLQELVTTASRITTLSTLFLLFSMIFFGKFLLSFFGQDFISGYSQLLILGVGQFFNALAGPVGLLLTMTSHQKDASLYLLISAIVNLVLNFALIPYLGSEGAAISTTISTVLWNFLLSYRVYKLLGIKTILWI